MTLPFKVRWPIDFVMLKETTSGKKYTVVPLHTEIDKGTLLEIIRQTGFTKEEFLGLI